MRGWSPREIRGRSRRSACSFCRSTSTPVMRCGSSRGIPSGLASLLKERVSDVAVLTDAVRRIAEGECVIDPTIVSQLMRRRDSAGTFAEATNEERNVASLVAEGYSDESIAQQLHSDVETVRERIERAFALLGIRQPGRPPSCGSVAQGPAVVAHRVGLKDPCSAATGGGRTLFHTRRRGETASGDLRRPDGSATKEGNHEARIAGHSHRSSPHVRSPPCRARSRRRRWGPST